MSTRSLGFNLTDINEFPTARDPSTLPCKRVRDAFDQRITDIDQRIADLLNLRDMLKRIRQEGAALPLDKQCDDQCISSLAAIN